jgi:hypothetical protein
MRENIHRAEHPSLKKRSVQHFLHFKDNFLKNPDSSFMKKLLRVESMDNENRAMAVSKDV